MALLKTYENARKVVITDKRRVKSDTEDTTMAAVRSTNIKGASLWKHDTTIKKSLIIMAVSFTFTLIYVNIILLRPHLEEYEQGKNWYLHQKVACTKQKNVLGDMVRLAKFASRALSTLGVTSAVCYGTLIGALRRSDVLPWDNNVDLCVVDTIPSDFKTIQSVFGFHGIEIHPYDSWKGRYVMTRNGVEGFIHVFSKCSLFSYIRFRGKMNQESQPDVNINDLYWGMDGGDLEETPLNEGDSTETHLYEGVTKTTPLLETDSTTEKYSNIVGRTQTGLPSFWLCHCGTLPFLAHVLDCVDEPIPASLFQTPLPSLKFGKDGGSINIPHGDSLILKYFYPKNWWLDARPVGC